MKNLFLCLLMFCAFGLSAQNINLKMPSDFYYQRTPVQNKNVKFTISTKLDAINMIVTDNEKSEKLGRNSTNRQKKNKPGILLALPKLYKIAEGNDGSKTFSFGKEGGEDGVDDATVKLTYAKAAPSTELSAKSSPVKFGLSKKERHTANKRGGKLDGEHDFLYVEASTNNTATFTINRNPKQGNVIVGIFNSKNGQLLGTLNPKDPEDLSETLSFTTAKPVFVIPVIRPKVTKQGGKDVIVFEVGDPRENGSAESEEE